jgi:hypothetical protein
LIAPLQLPAGLPLESIGMKTLIFIRKLYCQKGICLPFLHGDLYGRCMDHLEREKRFHLQS